MDSHMRVLFVSRFPLALLFHLLYQRCVSDFIQALMLILELRPQLVNVRFEEPQRCIGFLDDGMIARLRPTRGKDGIGVDAGKLVQSRPYADDRRADVVLVASRALRFWPFIPLMENVACFFVLGAHAVTRFLSAPAPVDRAFSWSPRRDAGL